MIPLLNSQRNYRLMKTRRITALCHFLAALCLFCHPVFAQLKLPWETEEAPKPVPEEPVPGLIPEKIPDAEPEAPPPVEEAAEAPTAVEAVYRAWADRIFAKTKGSVRIGSPQSGAKKVSVSVSINGERTTMVFIEKTNDGRRARVIAGPKDSEGEYFSAERKERGWVLSSWPKGFRATATDIEPVPGVQPEPNGAPAITWDDLCSRRLSRRDLEGISRAELRLLRNEIYARHGQIFKSEDLQAHFGRQPWYRPRYTEVDESRFSATLKHNISVIQAVEKE